MGNSKLILSKYLVIVPDKFAISVKVFEVSGDVMRPEGVKTSFVLLDLETNAPTLLVDNHAPFGFHMHTGLPNNKHIRVKLEVTTYQEAYEAFMVEVERRVKDSKN